MAYFSPSCSLPSTRPGGAAEVAARARAAADELVRAGDTLRFLRIILAPDDETCFVAYEAAGAESVAEAERRAASSSKRIVAAIEAPLTTQCLVARTGDARRDMARIVEPHRPFCVAKLTTC